MELYERPKNRVSSKGSSEIPIPILIAPKVFMLHDESTRDRFERFFRWAMPFEIIYEVISFKLLSERLMHRTLSYESLDNTKGRF